MRRVSRSVRALQARERVSTRIGAEPESMAERGPGQPPSAAGGPLPIAVRAGELPRVHRVIERARARPAEFALGVETAAAREREATAAGAGTTIGDARERLALRRRQRGQVEVGDLVHPLALLRSVDG